MTDKMMLCGQHAVKQLHCCVSAFCKQLKGDPTSSKLPKWPILPEQMFCSMMTKGSMEAAPATRPVQHAPLHAAGTAPVLAR